jgi:hypothetical protein
MMTRRAFLGALPATALAAPAAAHRAASTRQPAVAPPVLLGVVAGHIHKPSLDVVDGIPQLVVVANAEGGQLHVECDAARRPAAHEPSAARL